MDENLRVTSPFGLDLFAHILPSLISDWDNCFDTFASIFYFYFHPYCYFPDDTLDWNEPADVSNKQNLSTKVTHFEYLALKTRIPENPEEKTTILKPLFLWAPWPWSCLPGLNDLLIQQGGTFRSRKSRQRYIATVLKLAAATHFIRVNLILQRISIQNVKAIPAAA